MSPEQARELIRLAEPALLSEVGEHLKAHGPLRTRGWLDQRFPAQASLALLDCVATQLHFWGKFEQAGRWLLTREAAEQATAAPLARWRAEYLRDRFPLAEALTEVGTGIGGDTVYLARHFEVRGYEQDEARALLAGENVARLSPEGAAVVLAVPARVEELSGEVLFADPARRGATRKFDPESWDPPLSSLLAQDRFPGVVLKTAPGLDLGLLPLGMEAHFLSMRGELKEAMLLKSPLEVGSPRHAWLWQDEGLPLHRQGTAEPAPVREPHPGDYLHSPDPSVIRSGLLAGLARDLDGGVVHGKIAYLCGPRPSLDAWATSFEVLERMPLRWKALEATILGTDWSEFEILTRGMPLTPEEILGRLRGARKKMKGRAGGRGTLIFYRGAADHVALLARRAI